MCHSVFIEKIGQGLERFMGGRDVSTLSAVSAALSFEEQVAATLENINNSTALIEQSQRLFETASLPHVTSSPSSSSSGAHRDLSGAGGIESIAGGFVSRSRRHLQGELPGSVPAGVAVTADGSVVQTADSVAATRTGVSAAPQGTPADEVREVPGDELVHNLLSAIFTGGRNGVLPGQVRHRHATGVALPGSNNNNALARTMQGFMGEEDPLDSLGGGGGSGGGGWADLLHHILMNEDSYARSRPATAEAVQRGTRSIPLQTTSDLIQYCGADSMSERAKCSRGGIISGRSGPMVDVDAPGPPSEHVTGEYNRGDESIVCCPITQEQFRVGDEALIIACCGIVFHKDALMTWFRSRDTCPICRKSLDGSGSG